MKRIVTITVLLLILALAVTLTACSCSSPEAKEETVYDILTDTIQKTAASQTSDHFAIWEDALAQGSLTGVFQFNDDSLLKTISAKYTSGKTASVGSLSLALPSGESFDLSLFRDLQTVILQSSALTQAYGYTPDAFTAFLYQYLLGTQNNADATASFALIEALEKHEAELKTIVESRVSITLNQAESSMNFSFLLSNATVKEILSEVIAVLEKDADFKKAYVDYSAGTNQPMTDTDVDNMLKEALENLNDLDKEPFTASVSITATNERTINSASVTIYEGVATTGAITNQKQTARILISLPASGGFNIEANLNGQTYTAAYTVSEFGSVTKETLSIGAMGLSLTPFALTYDNTTGDYELKVDVTGVFSASVHGNYTETKTEATLTVSQIKVTLTPSYGDMSAEDIFAGIMGGFAYDLPIESITLTAKTKDSLPKAPTNFTDASKLNESELTELGETIMNDPVVAAIAEYLEALFSSGTEEIPTPAE